MGWFKKRNDVIDLGERYRKQQQRLKELKEETEQQSASDSVQQSAPSGIGIFGMSNSTTVSSTPVTSSSDEGVVDLSGGADEKRRRLAKRLMDMTDKIEDLNNQIYHLQQRIEVLEQKGGSSANTSGFGMFN